MQSKCWQDISDQCAEKEKDCFHCFAVLSSLQTYMKFFIHKIQRMNEKFYRSSSWLFFPKRQCGGDHYQPIHKIGVVHSRPAGNGGVAAVGPTKKVVSLKNIGGVKWGAFHSGLCRAVIYDAKKYAPLQKLPCIAFLHLFQICRNTCKNNITPFISRFRPKVNYPVGTFYYIGIVLNHPNRMALVY